MTPQNTFPVLTPDEAVSFIHNGNTVSFSGFSPAGAAKIVPHALARRAQNEHESGRPFQVRVLTGASSGQSIDDALAGANAISWRAPYQGESRLRRQINQELVEYVDIHLSHLPQLIEFGFLGQIDIAVIEATEITPDGRVYLTTSIGASPTYLHHAKKVIIEINRHQSPRLREMADIYRMPLPPHRNPIPVYEPLTRIGWPYANVDPAKIIGIVENDEADHVAEFTQPDTVSDLIADHLVKFLVQEMRCGRIPPEFLPLQAGVGNICNSVMAKLGASSEFPCFKMYTEVYQDSLVDLMDSEKLLCASACALAVSSDRLQHIVDNIDFFGKRIVLRPQEISNHPGIIRRLGVIAMNTAIEADIYGNVNSTHIYGADIMNGIGGSGEFTRNGYMAIFMTPSIAKNGKISCIVPMCPHIDNNEHSVQILVTEQGIADLRGLGPMQRARAIIDNCAHPLYRDYLHAYVSNARPAHIRHDLAKCYELHQNLLAYGAMLPVGE